MTPQHKILIMKSQKYQWGWSGDDWEGRQLTWVELFDDELDLSVGIMLIFLDETSQDFFHALQTKMCKSERE